MTVSQMKLQISNHWSSWLQKIRVRRGWHPEIPSATEIEVKALQDGVLELKLAGGNRRNVLGRSTIDYIERMVANPPTGTKVIVITAALPDFCAGYDLMEANHANAIDLIARETNFDSLRKSQVPILVALHGNVIGGGLELALSADIRLASPDTVISIPASQLGLVYSETGIRLVVAAVGDSVARALFLGGRKISADSALSMGLISEIVGRDQLRDRTIELANEIALWPSAATSGNRQILDAIAGRIAVDTTELRRRSFDQNGELAKTIADFAAERFQNPRRTQ